ncbi:DUF4435 domain-containing protein [Pseudoalteromonas sp. S554]|uniref:DUF4435 domain-containing protein n=1 Tax=Pseudoalteromonas sp. S554 TaxID=2066516 RepID=UPI001487568D|nr:DUF4435 domain-containing protein [Pseudoalteromonas sp. S554]
MSNRVTPSVQEIVSTLKRSSLPTLVIEGSDDVYIYRYLKSKLSSRVVSIQPCGGRSTLFKIHDRKHEFADKNIVFIADKDSYRFDGIPDDRKDIIFTEGYCIENDIYQGSTIHSFIDEEDSSSFELLRTLILRWYAFELERYNANQSENKTLEVSAHINVISPDNTQLCPLFSQRIGFREPNTQTLEFVANAYDSNVRGKQLFQMLSRFMSKKGRFSSFSDKNLVEIALKQGGNDLLQRLVCDMENKLAVA